MKKHLTQIIIVSLVIGVGVISYVQNGGGNDTVLQDEPEGAVTIVDDLGRSVQVMLPAKRIISTYSGNTECLLYVGAKESIVGVATREAEHLGVRGVGSHIRPDIEAILACNPDLVIVSSSRKAVVEKMEPMLNKFNIQLLAFHPRTVSDTLNHLERLSMITGKPLPESTIDNMRKQLKEIGDKVKLIPQNKRPKVFFEVSCLRLLTCGKDSLPYNIITLAGGRPVASMEGSVKPFDLEMLIGSAPDFYIQQKGAMNKAPIPPNEHKVVNSMDCIKAGRFATVDEALVSRPGPRVIEAVGTIHNLLYPENNE